MDRATRDRLAALAGDDEVGSYAWHALALSERAEALEWLEAAASGRGGNAAGRLALAWMGAKSHADRFAACVLLWLLAGD